MNAGISKKTGVVGRLFLFEEVFNNLGLYISTLSYISSFNQNPNLERATHCDEKQRKKALPLIVN